MEIKTVRMFPATTALDIANDLLDWLPASYPQKRVDDDTPLAEQSISALNDDAVAFAKIILRVREQMEEIKRLHSN